MLQAELVVSYPARKECEMYAARRHWRLFVTNPNDENVHLPWNKEAPFHCVAFL